jgi:hypothetical protein
VCDQGRWRLPVQRGDRRFQPRGDLVLLHDARESLAQLNELVVSSHTRTVPDRRSDSRLASRYMQRRRSASSAPPGSVGIIAIAAAASRTSAIVRACSAA